MNKRTSHTRRLARVQRAWVQAAQSRRAPVSHIGQLHVIFCICVYTFLIISRAPSKPNACLTLSQES